MHRTITLGLLAATLALGGCTSTHLTKPVVQTLLRPAAVRGTFFESTLRVLDENPTYVDEFVRLAHDHPRTLDRFNAAYSPMLAEPAIANSTAEHLVHHPESLRQVLVSSLDHAEHLPEARDAIATAIQQRSDLSAEIITEHHGSSLAITRSTVRAAQQSAANRAHFLAGLRANSAAVARMILGDGATTRVMTRAMVNAGGHQLADRVEELVGAGPHAPPAPAARGGGQRP